MYPKLCRIVAVVVATACSAAAAIAQPSTAPAASTTKAVFTETNLPPLLLPTADRLEALRMAVADDPAIAAVFARDVLAPAEKALQRQPRPLAQIIYEGRVSGDPERVKSIEHLRDMADLRLLTWAAAIGRDRRHVEAAIDWTVAWVTACPPTGNDVNDNKLDSILFATSVLADQMPQDEREKCLVWSRELGRLQAQGVEQAHANRMAKRIKLMAAAGVVTGDTRLVDRAADHFRHFVDTQLRPDGTSVDLEMRDALSYHCAGLRNMLEVALLLSRSGVDLYGYQSSGGASLRRSVDLVNPYALGEKVHPEWVNTKVDLDRRRWEAGDELYRPGRPWNPATSLDMYRLAHVFDPSLQRVIEHVRTRAEEPLTWFDVALGPR